MDGDETGGADEDLRALVTRASRSDPDAWEALYRRTYARLYNYAARRVPGNPEADDVVSETFARAYAGIGRFGWRKHGGFDAWLYGILRNVLREARRAREKESDPVGDPEQRERSAQPDALSALLANEEAADVRAAFGELSPADQEVLELRVVGGLDANQVAKVLGKRPGAVRMAQSRALERLRSLLPEEWEGS